MNIHRGLLNMNRKLQKVGLFLGITKEENFVNTKTGLTERMVWILVRFEIDTFVKEWELEVYRDDRIAAVKALEQNTLVKIRATMKEDQLSKSDSITYRLFLDSFERAKTEDTSSVAKVYEKPLPISPEDLALIIEDDYRNNRKETDNDCMITRLAIIKSSMEKEHIEEFYARYHRAMKEGKSPSDYYR